MKYITKTIDVAKQKTDCLIIGVYQDQKLTGYAALLDKISGKALSQLLAKGDFSGQAEQTLMLYHLPKVPAERVLLVGLGENLELSAQSYRKIVQKVFAVLKETPAKEAILTLAELKIAGQNEAWKIREVVTCGAASQYEFNQLKSTPKMVVARKLNQMTISLKHEKELNTAKSAIKEGQAIANAIKLAKNLGNLPGNICTPTYMATQAKLLAKHHKKVSVKVLSEADMQKLKMGALLSVSRGSHEEAKLIVMHYRGGKKHDKPIALVGKGVTFDSGGISLKPGQCMDEMKYDMLGAASVLATIQAAAELNLPLNLVAVTPCTENLPGHKATKPGDIVTSMSGLTIEVLNTDAEGRLILADALTYCAQFKPELIIDVATLTGAIIVALGGYLTGVFSKHDNLANEILTASQQSQDLAWRMPLMDCYGEDTKSNFADMTNIGNRGAGGSSSLAASFLSRFVDAQTPWVHLDMAGTGWVSGAQKGASGRPISLLVQFLLNRSHAKSS